ncbi:uncharacterized protein LOC133524770 [Cydia pomonella]|uniref:uncharacterized protein LOC133524770 n=1 Tax=Cydia pomonella TaxID=82600 RepID=UPI002ADD8799|nr:uncharacterized protein LOC133524770 [Cydia pomonella]
MPFKVIQTMERGCLRLTTVPEQWEKNGTLFWPKTNAEKLRRRENCYPDPTWRTFNCILKRSHLPIFKDAENQIDAMSDRSDTETENEYRNNSLSVTTQREPLAHSFNKMAQELVENDQENIAAAMLEKENIPPGENYDAAVNIVQTLEPNSLPETIDLGCENTDNQSQNILILNQDVPLQQIQEDIQALKHDLKTILTNQNALFELQNKLLLKHSEFQTQFEEYIKLSSKLPAQDRDDGINTIKTSNDFDDFERNLLDAVFKEDHKKKLRGLCSRGSGKGTSNAYYLIDHLFDREFLKSCTWTGSSKKDPVKICFKARERTINFFHDIVKESDETFSKADCEKFFKIILKNAHQRCESNKRASSARQRTKGKKTKNDTATTSSVCAIEQPAQEDNVRPPPEPLLDQPVPAIPESSEQNQLENVEVINLPSAAAVLPEN